jgi:hypothetical protein
VNRLVGKEREPYGGVSFAPVVHYITLALRLIVKTGERKHPDFIPLVRIATNEYILPRRFPGFKGHTTQRAAATKGKGGEGTDGTVLCVVEWGHV